MNLQGMNVDFEKLFPQNPPYIEEEARCKMEDDYIKRTYSNKLRMIVKIVENYLDQYEYEDSPIFMEYLDKESLYQIANEIKNQWDAMRAAQNQEIVYELENDREIIYVMICHEIYVRRRRKENYLRHFYSL